MNETERVALFFILKENQKKGRKIKNHSQRKPEQKWGGEKKRLNKKCVSIQEDE